MMEYLPGTSHITLSRYRRPDWPAQDVPKQLHLDLAVDDLDTAETAAVELGAHRADQQPAPDK
jgi:hypothetical protein